MSETALIMALAAAVAAGTPLFIAGLGELLTERSGVINIGVEGMMLVGAVTAFLVANGTSSVALGLFAGSLAGASLALLHAILSVSLRANQIVSGLALVIFGTGVATFIGRPIEGLPLAVRLGRLEVPHLSEIPLVGQILFRQDIVVYASWLLALVVAVYLSRTRWGLSVRAVGESPATADVMGIGVAAVQYAHTIVGGLLAGASGAYLILARAPNWSQAETTSGLGWIAVALGRLLVMAALAPSAGRVSVRPSLARQFHPPGSRRPWNPCGDSGNGSLSSDDLCHVNFVRLQSAAPLESAGGVGSTIRPDGAVAARRSRWRC